MELMMQSLLEDRFKLAMHSEAKEGAVYALEMVKSGKLGSQLRPHPEDPSCSAGNSAATQSAGAQILPARASGLRCRGPFRALCVGTATTCRSQSLRNIFR